MTLHKPRAICGMLLAATVLGQTGINVRTMPARKTRPSAQAVVDEHMDALNHCDWQRLMAQYPDEVEIFLPGGVVLKGREKVGDMFAEFVKPASQGGLCGVKFTAEHVFPVGNTINVQWSATADFFGGTLPWGGRLRYQSRPHGSTSFHVRR